MMNKYKIRFNKSRGNQNRGTPEHIWRVFENDKEYLFKHLDINSRIVDEIDDNGKDWNIVCWGYLTIDRSTSTAVITSFDSNIINTCNRVI